MKKVYFLYDMIKGNINSFIKLIRKKQVIKINGRFINENMEKVNKLKNVFNIIINF